MSEKSKLPNDWIKCKSKKHPDKHYYFNKTTGESSWTDPTLSSSETAKPKAATALPGR